MSRRRRRERRRGPAVRRVGVRLDRPVVGARTLADGLHVQEIELHLGLGVVGEPAVEVVLRDRRPLGILASPWRPGDELCNSSKPTSIRLRRPLRYPTADAREKRDAPRHGFRVRRPAIGSGAGGLSTAIAARKQGLDVIVVEKEPVFGGTTAFSGGVLWIPGNGDAKDAGIAGRVRSLHERRDRRVLRTKRVEAFLEPARACSISSSARPKSNSCRRSIPTITRTRRAASTWAARWSPRPSTHPRSARISRACARRSRPSRSSA